VSKSDVVLDHEESIPELEATAPFTPWKPIGGKLNITWEQVTKKNPDTSKIADLPGVNVISPTWFSLADGDGNVSNIADPAYVKWAQSRNYQIWALFSNGFEPKRTSEALSTYDRRMNTIKQLIGFAQIYKLNGFNIDFENVYTKDKENLVQFVREMTPLLHEQGLVVSIDVTPKSSSEMWSVFYDRPALAKVVDYMMLMAYDEHWASSPEAGSVASLPWVEKSLTRLLEEDHIAPSKLVLGVPFYTRLWTEEVQDGKTTVTSKALGMESAQAILKEKKLTPAYNAETGQNYVEYKEGTKLMRIWLEDETSVKARFELVKKYNLAGVASWRRGFETPDIWTTIVSSLEKRP
jgi:spore germination protein YaaH